MAGTKPAESESGSFDLERFIRAQDPVYSQVLAELRAGRKRSHWMWYVFPQLAGLGHSATARFYALTGPGEASAYLAHPVLGSRLQECSETLLKPRNITAFSVFGYPDELKLRSSMTLFAEVSAPGSVFVRVLDRFFAGQRDSNTLQLLAHRD